MRKILGVCFIAIILISGCTANQRAKQWGGTMTINLPANQKLINATWKNDDLWYLIKPMKEDDIPQTSELIENSSFGIIEGKVVFIESK